MKKTERQKRLEDLSEVQGIEADMMEVVDEADMVEEEVVVDELMARPHSVPLLYFPQARLALQTRSGRG